MTFVLRQPLPPSWWTLPNDGEHPAEFLLAPLSSLAMIDVRNAMSRGPSGNLIISAAGVLTAVRESVRDWRHVFDGDGQPIKFQRSRIEDLESDALLAIATQVINTKIRWDDGGAADIQAGEGIDTKSADTEQAA